MKQLFITRITPWADGIHAWLLHGWWELNTKGKAAEQAGPQRWHWEQPIAVTLLEPHLNTPIEQASDIAFLEHGHYVNACTHYLDEA